MKDFLKVSKNQIVENGRPVRLNGVNLGGWLMMEGYFFHAPNRAVRLFKEDFEKRLGPAALSDFEKAFRSRFICEKDFQILADMGCRCVRLPFHYGLIETAPYEYDLDGAAWIDKAVRWARTYGLRVILDLHAAPGAQNHDWHSDSLGEAGLWASGEYQKRVASLWQFVADRYKNNPVVAGYDILNEAVVSDSSQLNEFYARVIRAIRQVDRNHILFLEGNTWAMDLKGLDDFDDDNWAYSIHFYHPIDFTFHFIPQLTYPLKSGEGVFDRSALRGMVDRYRALAARRPVFVGEFGIHSRRGVYGDDGWLKDVLECFEEAGLHWTYWTYKAVKNYMFPDGIYSYFPNDPWVNRQGPKTGWETWADLWPSMRTKIVRSWETRKFDADEGVVQLLKQYF